MEARLHLNQRLDSGQPDAKERNSVSCLLFESSIMHTFDGVSLIEPQRFRRCGERTQRTPAYAYILKPPHTPQRSPGLGTRVGFGLLLSLLLIGVLPFVLLDLEI